MSVTRAITVREVRPVASYRVFYSLFVVPLSPDANVLIIFTVRTVLPSSIFGIPTSIRAKRVN